MAFKKILVHLDNHPGYETRLQLALSIAKPDKAHLVALYGFELPRVPSSPLIAEAYVGNLVSRPSYAYERERDAAYLNAAQIQAAFRAEAKNAGLTGDWQICPDDAADFVIMVTEQARYADLAVLGQVAPDHPFFDRLATLPETVMMGSGRPVLIVPYAGRVDTVAKNVLVAWSGTREAARAVGDAMPLLRSAEAVTVLSIGSRRDTTEHLDQPAASLVRHLARHDIHAEASHLVSNDIEVGELIMSRATDLGCDLIVMGGYGHSRLRELILGGVTRAVLQHMTVPVLMSH